MGAGRRGRFDSLLRTTFRVGEPSEQTTVAQLHRVRDGVFAPLHVVRVPKNMVGRGSGLAEIPASALVGDPRRLLYWKGRWIERARFKQMCAAGEIGVRWTGPLGSGTGYGEACREHLAALLSCGANATAKDFDLGGIRADYGVAARAVAPVMEKPLDYAVNVVYTPPPWFVQNKESGCKNVGMFFWETERLPAGWVSPCNQMDEIWVPCEWTARACKDSGVKRPIRVFGCCASPEAYEGVVPLQIPGVDPSWFKFYSVFQWTPRKNPWGLLSAYLSAFTVDDPVVLILKTYKRDGSPQEEAELQREIARFKEGFGGARAAKVVLITRSLSRAELLGLHAAGDCFVTMTRAEGWGLPIFDASWMRKPSIVPAHGATLDFTTNETSYLVGCRMVPVDWIEPAWYARSMTWAEPSVEECWYWMRHAVAHKEELAGRGRLARGLVEEKFSWRAVGESMKMRLASMWEDL